MKIDNFSKEEVILFIKRQWKGIALGAVVIIFLIATILIPSGSRSASAPNSDKTGNVQKNSGNGKKSSSILDFIFGSKKDDKAQNQGNSVPAKIPPALISSQGSQSTVTQISAGGKQTIQKLTNNIINTSQGTINPNSSISQNISSGATKDNVSIVFQNPDGSTFTYIPPGTPPDEVRWARYTNNKSKYAINYPYNWQFVYSIDDDGFEGVALYPPGVTPGSSNSPYIGFGMSKAFLLPAVGDIANAYVTPEVADGVEGSLYTNGPIGNSYMASIFSYTNNYFGLGASKSDVTFVYVYYYMIKSLTFNVE